MYCPNCGSQNDDHNKFCWKCGEYLENEESLRTPKKKTPLILFIPLCLVVAFLIICTRFFDISISNIISKDKGQHNAGEKKENVNVDTNDAGEIIAEIIPYENGDSLYVPNEKLLSVDEEAHEVFFKNFLLLYTMRELNETEIQELVEKVDGELVGQIKGTVNVLQVKVEAETLEDLEAAEAILEESEDVLYAMHDGPWQMTENEADSNPWSSDKTTPDAQRGNEGNPSGNDWWAEAICAYSAWSNFDSENTIKVGVIDSGFDTKHEDLQGHISFLKNYQENSVSDHGTHVTGIIGANNNDVGIRGVADTAQIVCCDWSPKADRSVSYLSTGEYIEIIKQMIDEDVRIINNSWGGQYLSEEGYIRAINGNKEDTDYLVIGLEYLIDHSMGVYEEYIKYLDVLHKREALQCLLLCIQLLLNDHKDYIIVQAAGNGYDNGGSGVDAKNSGHFCRIDSDIYNIISEERRNQLAKEEISYEEIKNHLMIVGSVENKLNNESEYKMSDSSNYGATVDICAPGEDVYSTVAGNKYENMSGTSMAAPIVTGSLAQIWAIDPTLSAKEVKDLLLTSTITKAYGVGAGKAYKYPMLNIGKAVVKVTKDKNKKGNEKDTETESDMIEPESLIPEDAQEFNGHLYYIYNNGGSYEEAEAYCESLGGHLATITSQPENDFLFDYMVSCGLENAYFGFTDRDDEGIWKWVNGESVTFTNWHPDEPNNERDNENYAMFYWKYTSGEWNDGDFGNGTAADDINFICEWGEGPENDTLAAEESDWKTAYANYIKGTKAGTETGTETKYQLFWLNEDDVPELYINYGYYAAGGEICSFANGQATSLHIRNEAVYIDGKNGIILDQYEKHGFGVGNHTVYEFYSGEGLFNVIHQGIFNENSQEYEWDGQSLTKEQYVEKINTITDNCTLELSINSQISGDGMFKVRNQEEMLDFLQNMDNLTTLSEEEVVEKQKIEDAYTICRLIEEYYNNLYNTDEYVVFEDEIEETDSEYKIILRTTNGSMPNLWVTLVTVNKETGFVEDEIGNAWNLW